MLNSWLNSGPCSLFSSANYASSTMTTSFETQCIINAINTRLNAYEKSEAERERWKKRFKSSLRWEEGFYSSIILSIDDLNIDLI